MQLGTAACGVDLHGLRSASAVILLSYHGYVTVGMWRSRCDVRAVPQNLILAALANLGPHHVDYHDVRCPHTHDR